MTITKILCRSALALLAASCADSRSTQQQAQPLDERDLGLHIEVQDREYARDKPMRYAGSFVAREGTVRFEATLLGTEKEGLITTHLELGGTAFDVRFDTAAGLLTMRNSSNKPFPEGSSLVLAGLAESLQELYPPQDTTREPVRENYQGPDKMPALPHWITVRDFARFLNRWTLVGLDARDDLSGPDFDCEINGKRVKCTGTHNGSGGGGLPIPPATGCLGSPTDSGTSWINCCAGPGETWMHRSEHDAAHCLRSVVDECGWWIENDPSGQPQPHCAGKCGIAKGSTPNVLCVPYVTAGVPTQDCLDADICIESHWTNLGPGTGYCANEVAQTTDDIATTYVIEVAWTIATWGLDFPWGGIVQWVVQKVQECALNDPGKVPPPATRPRI
jgi:hypothetical protein